MSASVPDIDPFWGSAKMPRRYATAGSNDGTCGQDGRSIS